MLEYGAFFHGRLAQVFSLLHAHQTDPRCAPLIVGEEMAQQNKDTEKHGEAEHGPASSSAGRQSLNLEEMDWTPIPNYDEVQRTSTTYRIGPAKCAP